MASKYLFLKDHKIRKKYKRYESKHIAIKSVNFILNRIYYLKQLNLFNKQIQFILMKNNKTFIEYKGLLIPNVLFSFNLMLKLRRLLNSNYLPINLFDYNSNLLIRYVNLHANIKPSSSLVRIKNRCLITGRSHSVHRKFKLSRIQIRDLGSNNQLMGLSKAS